MSHDRDAIARAFSRPFIEPPQRAPTRRIGFTLAGVALLTVGLIVSERWPIGVTGDANGTNGVECTATTTAETATTKETTAGTPFLIEFLPGNRARFSIIWEPGQDTVPMTTTDREYTFGARRDTAHTYDSGATINRVTGDFASFNIWDRDSDWHRVMISGTCHAAHIAAKM